MGKMWIAVGIVAATLLAPDGAWAWGPGTHLKLAEIVYLNRAVLPLEVADLIGRFPALYFYGNIIADLILGKDVGITYDDHSHNWSVAFRMLDRAEDPPLRAVLWGYLSHLAADVVAHNVYVPAQFVHSSPGRGRGHAFWEMHYDGHVADRFVRASAHIQRLGSKHADRFLMRELAETVFTHRTNRWIFNGTLVVQRMRAYRQIAQRTIERSPFKVGSDAVEFFDDLNLRAINNVLDRGRTAAVVDYDPTGSEAQEAAKHQRQRLRRARADRTTPRDWPPAPDHHEAREEFLNGLNELPPHRFSQTAELDTHMYGIGQDPDDV